MVPTAHANTFRYLTLVLCTWCRMVPWLNLFESGIKALTRRSGLWLRFVLLMSHIKILLLFLLSFYELKWFISIGWKGWFWDAWEEGHGMGWTERPFCKAGKPRISQHSLFSFFLFLTYLLNLNNNFTDFHCCRNLLRWYSNQLYKVIYTIIFKN